MNDYSGFHVGIVVENDDPELGGRVKVWVPEFSPNLDAFHKWIKENKTVLIKTIDKDMSPEMVEILDDLKKSLPWAEYAGPMFGGSSDGRFHCPTKTTSTNDNDKFGDTGAQNGFRPLNQYMGSQTPTDDFCVEDSRTINLINPNGAEYEPTNYSGMPRGVFAIPNVGAQVYVFYLNNDPMYPVYFAAAYDTAAIRKIYTQAKKSDDVGGLTHAYDYPNEFENGNDEDTDDSRVFRSKTVLNSNKHTLEFVDTDGHEAVKLQHYGGAFKQYTNYGSVEFIPGSDQKLVMSDQFSTIKGDNGVSIGGNESHRVRGDRHVMVGEYDAQCSAVSAVKAAMDEVADVKRLFPVKRALSGDIPNDTSTLQTRVPAKEKGFLKCPTCGGLEYNPYNVNGLNLAGTYIDDTTTEGKALQHQFLAIYAEQGGEETALSGFARTNSNIKDAVEYGWSRIPKALSYCSNTYEELDPYFSKGYLDGDDLVASGSTSIDDVYGSKGEAKRNPHAGTGKVGVFGGIKCPTCNNGFWTGSEQTSGWSASLKEMSGYSPSTEKGNWVEEELLSPTNMARLVDEKFRKAAENLAAIGGGGDEIETVSMSRVTTIGTVFNDVPSFRVDPIGKLRLDGLYVTQQSTVPYYLPTPHVEPVDVTSVPGGDWNLTIGNKWNVSVGSQGINIKTTGSLQIGGAIAGIATEELNLSSKNDMIIDGGERLMIRARKMTINPVEHNALTIDGQLHVLRNVIIRGGELVEGELAVQHITAPGELTTTGPEIWVGDEESRCYVAASLKIGTEEMFNSLSDKIKEYSKNSGSGSKKQFGSNHDSHHYESSSGSSSESEIGGILNTFAGFFGSEIEVVIGLPVHKHSYMQIPTTFKDCPNAVRGSLLGVANNINSRQIVVSSKRRHHVGLLIEDELPGNIYLKNADAFNKVIWEAMCKNGHGIEEDLTKVKGIKKSENPQNPANASCYAYLFYSGLEGTKGVCLFYTIRDYYKSCFRNAKDIAFGALLSSNVIVRLEFDILPISDDDDLGEMQTDKITSGDDNLSSDQLSDRYDENSVSAGLVNSSLYSKQFKEESVEAKTTVLKAAWLLKWDKPSGV